MLRKWQGWILIKHAIAQPNSSTQCSVASLFCTFQTKVTCPDTEKSVPRQSCWEADCCLVHPLCLVGTSWQMSWKVKRARLLLRKFHLDMNPWSLAARATPMSHCCALAHAQDEKHQLWRLFTSSLYLSLSFSLSLSVSLSLSLWLIRELLQTHPPLPVLGTCIRWSYTLSVVVGISTSSTCSGYRKDPRKYKRN